MSCQTDDIRMTCVVARGEQQGETLVPHVHKDGKYVASMTRFEVDYIRVESIRELAILVKHGFSVRMSNPDGVRAASLIAPSSIRMEVASEAG